MIHERERKEREDVNRSKVQAAAIEKALAEALDTAAAAAKAVFR